MPFPKPGSTAWGWFRCWILTDASSLFHEPPDAERHVRVVWEDGGSNPASYPISEHVRQQRVRELTRRTQGISLEQMTKELATSLRGWKSYFGFGQAPSVLRRLEEGIRRRLRSVIWGQWKRDKARYVRLRQRNIGHDLAAQTAGSPHGPWRLAISPALQSALPIAYFDSCGLPRLLDAL